MYAYKEMKIAKRNNKKKTITNLYVIPRHRNVCVCVCETGRRTKRTEARLFVFVAVIVVVLGAMWAWRVGVAWWLAYVVCMDRICGNECDVMMLFMCLGVGVWMRM